VARYTFAFAVPAKANYSFWLGADDAARLYLDGSHAGASFSGPNPFRV
jgi:hypothetical protein